MNKKTVIIDISSYLFRAYHALPPLKNKDGFQVNALYGFVTMFLKLTQKFRGASFIAAVDSRTPTFRKKKFPEYKANRKEIDPELKEQLKYTDTLLEALNIKSVGKDGFEADDVIATLVSRHEKKDSVCIVSADKDLMQLIGDNVEMYDGKKKSFITPEYVEKRFGVPPSAMKAFLAMTGDASDNIPGVPGIGKKTASALLQEYETIENIYKNMEKISGRARKALLANKDKLELSLSLVNLIKDVPVDNCRPKPWSGVNKEKFIPFAVKMNFKSALQQLGLDEEAEVFENPAPFRYSDNLSDKNGDEVIVFEYEKELYKASDGLYSKTNTSDLENIKKTITFHCKPFVDKIPLSCDIFDCQIACYLRDSGKRSFTLLHITKRLSISDKKPESAGEKASLINSVYRKIYSDSEKNKLLKNLEMPHVRVIREMEKTGIHIDADRLSELKKEFEEKISSVREKIFEFSGREFNINSPKQLGEILFEDLGLPVLKKTKTGPSTSHEVLEKLKEIDSSPVPAFIIEYREYTKLLSTYILPIIEKTCEDKRLRTSFIITHTATGRLASRDPNLQNIPVRTEEGKKIRSVFTAPPGRSLISLDYSQIELRILAHLSGDKELLEAFNNNEDIHRKTAAAIFNVIPEMVDDRMRDHAKAINFGIIYGMQAFRLSQETGVTISFARQYIDQYFKFYKSVETFINSTIEFAKKEGYVETMGGRRRFIPEINRKNKNLIRSGERMAVNTVIQGSAAEIIKRGTIKAYENIKINNRDADILLQIHDELIVESSEKIEKELCTELEKEMRSVSPEMSVVLDVNSKTGKKWSDLK